MARAATAARARPRVNPKVRRGQLAAEAIRGGGFGRTTLQQERYRTLRQEALTEATQPLLMAARDAAQRFQDLLRLPKLTPADQDLLVTWVLTFLVDADTTLRLGPDAAEKHFDANLKALQHQASPTLAYALRVSEDAVWQAWRKMVAWMALQVGRLIVQFLDAARAEMPELDEALRSPAVKKILQDDLRYRFCNLFPGTVAT